MRDALANRLHFRLKQPVATARLESPPTDVQPRVFVLRPNFLQRPILPGTGHKPENYSRPAIAHNNYKREKTIYIIKLFC